MQDRVESHPERPALTVIGGEVQTGVVNHGGGAGVDRFQCAAELAPEPILQREQGRSQIPARHVLENGVVAVLAFERRLVQMTVGANETGAHNPSAAVDDSERYIVVGTSLEGRFDGGNLAIAYEYIADSWLDCGVSAMDKRHALS